MLHQTSMQQISKNPKNTESAVPFIPANLNYLPQQFKNHYVEVTFLAEPNELREAHFIFEVFQELGFFDDLGASDIALLEFYGDFSVGVDVKTQVNFTEGAASNLLAHFELVVNADLVLELTTLTRLRFIHV